jgi:DNA-binding transcriptional LysR family regulator
VDRLGALTAFVRAAEARSFTEAGRQLSVSSSAIGKAIARLEDRLGVRLFHRSTRSVSLTPEGTMFLESCRRIFSEIENIELEFAQTKGAPRGKLRVSLPMGGTLMIPSINQFMSKFPEVELDLDFTDFLVDIIHDRFDVVIRTGNPTDSRLVAKTLGTYTLEAVGSPGYFKRAGMPQIPLDLLGHDCLHHKYPTSGKLQRWPFKPTSSGAEIDLPIKAAVNAIEPLIAMAEHGLGIACLPDFAVRRQVAEGTLVRVLGDHMEFSGAFRAVWPSSRQMSPKLHVFVDFMAENLFTTPIARLDQRKTEAASAPAILQLPARPGRDKATRRQATSRNWILFHDFGFQPAAAAPNHPTA